MSKTEPSFKETKLGILEIKEIEGIINIGQKLEIILKY